nr:hypothetical protein CFP56_73660 [Quercus suber]
MSEWLWRSCMARPAVGQAGESEEKSVFRCRSYWYTLKEPLIRAAGIQEQVKSANHVTFWGRRHSPLRRPVSRQALDVSPVASKHSAPTLHAPHRPHRNRGRFPGAQLFYIPRHWVRAVRVVTISGTDDEASGDPVHRTMNS